MRTSHRGLILSIIVGLIFVLGCSGLAGGAPPQTSGEPLPEVVSTASVPTSLPTSGAPQPTPAPAILERRRITLEFPPQIRAGDTDLVRLTLEVDDLGNITPTAEIGGHAVTGEVVEIPDLYESHHVIAEARFDIAGMEVRPAELSSEALARGNSVTFFWSIRPQTAGLYRGTVWLYLRFVDKQTSQETQKTLSAQIVEIKALNLLGLSGSLARTTGVVGSVLGTILGFPFLEDIVKFLAKRRIRLK